MPVFEIVIIEKPTKKVAEEGGIERLIYGPKAVVAKDGQAAVNRTELYSASTLTHATRLEG